MKWVRLRALRLPALAALVLSAVTMFVLVAPSGAGTPDTLGSQLAGVRAATAQYHRLEAALEAGYVQASGCVAIPTGGMGYHYVKPSLIDGALSHTDPEMLVYAPLPNGNLQLAAVEYVVPVAASATRPSLLGQPFDGPNDVGAPWGPQWDLHAWVWKHNPDGMFAPFNPTVSC